MIKVISLKEFLNAPDFSDYILSGHDNKIFMYAKNKCISTGDVIKDLKTIISRTCSVEYFKISDENMYQVVYGVFERWVEDLQKTIFWRNLFNKEALFFKETVSLKTVVSSMVSQIALVVMVHPHKELNFDKWDTTDLRD